MYAVKTLYILYSSNDRTNKTVKTKKTLTRFIWAHLLTDHCDQQH